MCENEKTRINRRGRRRGAAVAGILLTSLLLIVWPFQAAAHPPKEVALTYDAAALKLTVRITHSASTSGPHYIKKVEIKKDGKTITATEYVSQPDPVTFSYTYPVDAGTGSVLEVTATCSIFGSKTEKLDMRKTPR